MYSYLFYDLETTGLNLAFDQVLSFAAIRTDLNLNEMERHSLSVRLRRDVIPQPGAILTNRIDVNKNEGTYNEYQATSQIHELLNRPGTISIGYNTLGFDDEFLRFSFHRNLLPPYTHQYNNGCGRMDLLPMALIYRLYNPHGLKWPVIDGKPSMKLEHISKINTLAQGPAHDALVDVEASLALARIFSREETIWKYVCGYFDKRIDGDRMDNIPVSFRSGAEDHRKALLLGSRFGHENRYQIPAISMGRSAPYKNQTLWLRLDLPELQDTTSETIPESTWVVRKKIGEPEIVLPPHHRYWKKLDPQRESVVEENMIWLQSHPDLFQKIITYHRDYKYPFIPNLDADAALYQIGFLPRSDQTLCHQFHAASLEEKTLLVSKFATAEICCIAGRLLSRNFTDGLPDWLNRDFNSFLGQINPNAENESMADHRGQLRTSPKAALAEIERLQAEAQLTPDQVDLLKGLHNYIEKQFPN
jgi:exodeoxyribonuclease I